MLCLVLILREVNHHLPIMDVSVSNVVVLKLYKAFDKLAPNCLNFDHQKPNLSDDVHEISGGPSIQVVHKDVLLLFLIHYSLYILWDPSFRASLGEQLMHINLFLDL